MRSEFKVSLGQSNFQIYTPQIWATLSAGGLHEDIGRRKINFPSTACTYLLAHLLEPTSTENLLKQLASLVGQRIYLILGVLIHSCPLLG